MATITPIFLLSLPRSGSTFLQRLLATHPAIATASEPWILLPQLYTLRDQGAYSEYGHYLMASAVQDFARDLPGGVDSLRAEMRDYVLRLYGKAAGLCDRCEAAGLPRLVVTCPGCLGDSDDHTWDDRCVEIPF